MGLIVCDKKDCQYNHTTERQTFSTCQDECSSNHHDVVIDDKGMCVSYRKKNKLVNSDKLS
jgi:hypothetical protein